MSGTVLGRDGEDFGELTAKDFIVVSFFPPRSSCLMLSFLIEEIQFLLQVSLQTNVVVERLFMENLTC